MLPAKSQLTRRQGRFSEIPLPNRHTGFFQNIGAVLKAAGTSFEKVVKTTCFLKSLEDFNTFNEIYSQYFCGEIKPARSCVEVSKLPKGVFG